MADQYSLLLDLRRSEAAARGLAKLPHDFYRTTSNYLSEVRRTFETELRENPSSRKGELARQTYQRASQVARDLVEARMTKLLSLAFQASVGGTRDLPNALPEERALFDAILRDLSEHRQAVAPYLTPGAPPPTGRPEEPSPSAAHPAGPPPPVRPPGEHTDVLVRIVKDSKPLAIGTETIELRREDLLTVPVATAKILIEAKIAESVAATERTD